MFGRRRRVETEVLELVRRELESIRSEVQSALTDTAAVLSTRVRTEIEQRMGEPRAIVAGLADVRDGLVARETEVAHVLRRVGETCDALAERIQLDRVERTVLADAINRLAAALSVGGAIPVPALRPTVVGGTVDPELAEPVLPDAAREKTTSAMEIDLEAEAAIDAHRDVQADEPADPAITTPLVETNAFTPVPSFSDVDEIPTAAPRELPHDGVEVRCRFGDRWVTGFEVCEVIRFDDVTRYRLRRRSDGSVLPTLFEDRDVRFFSSLGESR